MADGSQAFMQSKAERDGVREKGHLPIILNSSSKEAVPEKSTVLEKRIWEFISKRIAKNETPVFAVYDLGRGEILAEVNSIMEIQAASMIKPFVALAFFHEVDDGKLGYDKNAKEDMRKMLVMSDNESTNRIMKRIGGPKNAERILKNSYASLSGMINISEIIPPEGKSYRNMMSAQDGINFLKALYKGELPHSAVIMDLLGRHFHNRIADGKGMVPRSARVCNKTGTTKMLYGDMGIMEANGAKYAIFAAVQRDVNEKYSPGREVLQKWYDRSRKTIQGVSDLVYEYFFGKNALEKIARKTGD